MPDSDEYPQSTLRSQPTERLNILGKLHKNQCNILPAPLPASLNTIAPYLVRCTTLRVMLVRVSGITSPGALNPPFSLRDKKLPERFQISEVTLKVRKFDAVDLFPLLSKPLMAIWLTYRSARNNR